jgi:FAD/FMN-containing dehydrogenase
MHTKSIILSNFSRSIKTRSSCYSLQNLREYTVCGKNSLARGAGLSYSDCCLNDQGIVLKTDRLNHCISFDNQTGILICEPAVTFADLFLIDHEYIPPVLPGTLYATLAGGVANDIHGKNNAKSGTLGQHILWLDLQIGSEIIRCSRETNAELFFATKAGLGLTGFIRHIALRLKKNSSFVEVTTEKYLEIGAVLEKMQDQATEQEYQVAWLDLLNAPRALLYSANHCEPREYNSLKAIKTYSILPLPFRLICKWNMKQFNQYRFQFSDTKKYITSLADFNNPLDRVKGWVNLYGPSGLLQFQAVFNAKNANETLMRLFQIIKDAQAIPTLSVLKYFSQAGSGLLSFVQPGFTIAIDFINNEYAKKAIRNMNAFITSIEGKVYLAKDLLLTKEQFSKQYETHTSFIKLLKQLGTPMHSDLAKRLGLIS